MWGIEGWKIRRELRRLRQQAAGLPVELIRKIYFRRWYDHVLSRQSRQTQGQIALEREAAIYLIFPEEGLLQSHRYMLDQMARAKLSPVVVSNLPLSDLDRSALLPQCSHIIERPNIGYDFGGYRDGVMFLASHLSSLDRLWLLNDSAWLVPQAQSWFEAARALDRDFVGATSNFALSRSDVPEFRKVGWHHDTSHRNFHYASYALAIGRRPLENEDFLRFWQGLDIRNDKKRTVRRGEIGLTQWMLRQGYSHGATCEVDRLKTELHDLSATEIDELTHELVLLDNPRLAELKAEVLGSDPESESGRLDRIALALFLVARQGAAYTLPGYLIRRRSFHFLKKSPIWLCKESAEITRHIAEEIEAGDACGIAAEVRALMHDECSDPRESSS